MITRSSYTSTRGIAACCGSLTDRDFCLTLVSSRYRPFARPAFATDFTCPPSALIGSRPPRALQSCARPVGTSCVFRYGSTSALWLMLQFGSHNCLNAPADPDGVALIYQYENRPLADATGTMHIHFGTAMLRVSDGNKLTGDYYAGRDRRTFGRISCCRLPRTIKQALGALRPRLTGSSWLR